MKTTSKWLSLAILLIAQLLTIMDIFIVNVALPSIQKSLQDSQADVQLIIAGYVLGFAIFLITGGRAGDYYGKKKVFILSLISFGMISVFCGISQIPLQLNIARFFQGISASFMMPQVLAYIQLLFPDQQERTKALGLYGVTIGLGTMLGQFLGGHLSSIDFYIAGWRWIFFVNVPICLLAILASWTYLKETVLIKNEKFDYSGTLVLTSALITLIYPLTQGRELNWPLWCILLLIVSVCLFYYFIKDQIKKTKMNKSPLIDVRLFKHSNFNIGLLVVSCFYMMLDSFFLMLSLFFQDGLSMSAIDAGTVIVIQGAGLMVSSVLAIRYIANHGKKILQAGVILIIISIVLQIIAFRNESISYSTIYLLLAIHGFGVGLVLPSIVNVALRGIPSELSGTDSGVYSTIYQTATALGICLVGGIFFYVLNYQTSFESYYIAYTYGNIANVFLLLIVLFLLHFLPSDKILKETLLHVELKHKYRK